MHELAIAKEIIDIVRDYLPKDKSYKIKSVKVELGKFSNIEFEALKFGFECLANETELKGATLDIEVVPLSIRCKECNYSEIISDPIFICPKCNCENVEITSGTEKRVLEIEILELEK